MPQIISILLIIASTFLLPSISQAIIRLDSSFSVTDTDYINYGNTFATVGRVTGGLAGSGTLIASNWVLTAGHLGTNTNNVNFSGVNYSVAETIRHPGYDGSTLSNDIMLVRLNSNIAGISPSSYVSQNNNSYMGNQIDFVGYGQSGTGDSTSRTSQGTKRGGTNVADATNGTSHFVFDFDNNTPVNNTIFTVGIVPSSQVPTSLEGQVASGDSGGPALYKGTIVGIASAE